MKNILFALAISTVLLSSYVHAADTNLTLDPQSTQFDHAAFMEFLATKQSEQGLDHVLEGLQFEPQPTQPHKRRPGVLPEKAQIIDPLTHISEQLDNSHINATSTLQEHTTE